MPGWRDSVRHRAGGSISGATNSSTSGVASGFFECDRRRRYNAPPILFLPETSVRIPVVIFFALLMIPFAETQQNQSPDTTPESAKQTASRKDKKQSSPASA